MRHATFSLSFYVRMSIFTQKRLGDEDRLTFLLKAR